MPIFLLKKVDAERTRIWTVTLAPQNKLYNRISLKRGVSLLRDFLCLEDRGTFFFTGSFSPGQKAIQYFMVSLFYMDILYFVHGLFS